jgi:predicted PurR-regulated permease PerM
MTPVVERDLDTRPVETDRSSALATRVLVSTVVVAAVLTSLLLVWYASDLLLLLFASVLVSIPLRRLQRLLQNRTRFGPAVSLAIVVLALLAVLAGGVVLSAGLIASHADEFVAQFQAALAAFREHYGGYRAVQQAMDRLPSLGELLFESGGGLSRLTGLASSTLGALVDAAIIAVAAVYLASEPSLYSNGLQHLLPFRYRRRASEVLAVLDQALGRWLIGRLLLMAINGGLTAIALWAFGVPLALTLGTIAGVLNFIPNVGPLIAAVPAVLIALMKGPSLAVYTAGIYLVVQMVDGYVLTPLVDRRSVELPPVLTISAQLLLGVLFGFVGLLVASPFGATAMILVKMLYVEDVLGDRVVSEPAAGQQESVTIRAAAS